MGRRWLAEMTGFGALYAKIARISMIATVVLGLGACSGPREAMPSGLYVSGDGEERITVEASRRIRFQVRLDETDPDRLFDREYESYSIWPESRRLQPFPMRSADALLGLGRYDWLWKDGKIAKTDPKTGEVIAWFEWQG